MKGNRARKQKLSPTRKPRPSYSIEELTEALTEPRVTEQSFTLAVQFIDDCRASGTAQRDQGKPSELVGYYVADLADALAACIEELVQAGDVMLARRLPAVVERLSATLKRYGNYVSPRFVPKNSIEALLQRHTAKDLLAMALAKEPNLQGVVRGRRLNWQIIRAYSEAQLREMLLGKFVTGTDQPHQPHPLARFIVRMFDLGERGFERPNINFFVELLWQGWFWSGSGRNFEECPWRKEQPRLPRAETRKWMQRIREHLRGRTQGDMSKLRVFRQLLARRKRKFAKVKEEAWKSLSDEKFTYQLGVVMDEIEEAWKTMANRASGKKRKAKTAR